MYIPKLAGEAIPAIWKCQGIKPGGKHILTYLALHMDRRGENIRPGAELCALETGYTKRTVEGWMRWLVENGFLIACGKFHYTDQYKLNLEKLGIVLVEEDEKTRKPQKFPHKTTLEKPPISGEEANFEHENGQKSEISPEAAMLKNMERLNRTIGSYWRLRQSNNPDAWVSEPGKDEVAVFLREYRAMVNRFDPHARRFELEAMHAEMILAEKGVKV